MPFLLLLGLYIFFYEYREHAQYGFIMVVMSKKLKYYNDICLLYFLALYIDPRVKFSKFEGMVNYLYKLLVKNDEVTKKEVEVNTPKLKKCTSTTNSSSK